VNPPLHRLRVVAMFAPEGSLENTYRLQERGGVVTVLSVEGAANPSPTFAPTWEADAKRGIVPAKLTVRLFIEPSTLHHDAF
jgi:hypothetical protein